MCTFIKEWGVGLGRSPDRSTCRRLMRSPGGGGGEGGWRRGAGPSSRPPCSLVTGASAPGVRVCVCVRVEVWGGQIRLSLPASWLLPVRYVLYVTPIGWCTRWCVHHNLLGKKFVKSSMKTTDAFDDAGRASRQGRRDCKCCRTKSAK